jgi:predicted NAD/FAD-dependent oxidoreductase
MSVDVIVIGAGIAGLACARHLADQGLRVVVLDKGRGIGGRMATRRVALSSGEARFDHGAQYVTAKTAEFRRMLDVLPGAWADWQDGSDQSPIVGVPGMSALPRALATGLDAWQEVEVIGLTSTPQGWIVQTADMQFEAPRVVLTVPAPQVAALLGHGHQLVQQIVHVTMAPSLTLMAAFPAGSPMPFASRRSETDPLTWIARDNSKPGRPDTTVTWVAQASSRWSMDHLEADTDAIAALMLPMLCKVIGTGHEDAVYAAAHRWRYAHVTQALGQPFLRSACGSLYLGGDWCLGPRVEAAWQSGDAIGRDITRGCRV